MTNKLLKSKPTEHFQMKMELENIKEQIVSLDTNEFYESNSINDIRLFLQKKARELQAQIERFECGKTILV
ncbi:hypothetical protein [Aureivirga sp. CE67]|uniref:hypothetical protein n=1 Tax=Aureivirga sp. CE67 TaxID=1788983 RepID=UPI0018CA899F|nr:hypothetical protein [Aureivirga sp. CE67]